MPHKLNFTKIAALIILLCLSVSSLYAMDNEQFSSMGQVSLTNSYKFNELVVDFRKTRDEAFEKHLNHLNFDNVCIRPDAVHSNTLTVISEPKSELRSLYKKEEQKLINCGWDFHAFSHVFLGEYVLKGEATRQNHEAKSLLLPLFEKRVQKGKWSEETKKDKLNLCYWQSGLLKGLHSLDALIDSKIMNTSNKLSNGWEVGEEDDSLKSLPTKFSYSKTPVTLDFRNYFYSNHLANNARTNFKDKDGNQKSVSGIKTFWPTSWSIGDILESTKYAIEEIKANKLKPSHGNLYLFSFKKFKIEMRADPIDKKNNDYLVRTAYPHPSDDQLSHIYEKQMKTGSSTQSPLKNTLSENSLSEQEKSVAEKTDLYDLFNIENCNVPQKRIQNISKFKNIPKDLKERKEETLKQAYQATGKNKKSAERKLQYFSFCEKLLSALNHVEITIAIDIILDSSKRESYDNYYHAKSCQHKK